MGAHIFAVDEKPLPQSNVRAIAKTNGRPVIVYIDVMAVSAGG